MNLLDLPEEVICLIFSLIPNEYLINFIDTPKIHQYGAKRLYSTIRIKYDYFNSLHCPLDDDGIPVLRNGYAYLSLLRAIPDIKPQKVIIHDSLDAIILAKYYPSSLTGIKTVVVVICLYDYFDQLLEIQMLASKYSINFQWDLKINNDNYLPSEHSTIPMNVRSLDIRNSHEVDKIFKNSWSNLIELRVPISFSHNEIKYLPDQLQILECKLFMVKAPLKENSLKLEFPSSLRTLVILEITYYPSSAVTIDFTLSSNLKILSIFYCDIRILEFCEWKFPKCLTSFTADFNPNTSIVWKTMCPELNEFVLRNPESDVGTIINLLKSLPPTLQRLVIPECMGFELPSNTKNSNASDNPKPKRKSIRNFLSRPKSLSKWGTEFLSKYSSQNLAIVPKHQDGSHETLYPGILSNLNHFEIIGILQVQTNYRIPSYLNGISTRTSKVDVDQFQYLHNLTSLKLISIQGINVFGGILPASLKKLVIDSCLFKEIHVNAKNLETLKIEGGSFTDLDDSHFTFPKNLKKLGIHTSKVKNILLKFPDSIELLDLYGNSNLKYIKQFPINMKSLLLRKTAICKRFTDGKTNQFQILPIFPLSLESLDLSLTEMDEICLRMLHLKEYTNLKMLCLRQNYSFDEIDLNCFPKSLVTLDLSYCSVNRFVGKFGSLPNLEIIGLAKNFLLQYFDAIVYDSQKIFNNKIKIIDLQLCTLSQKAVNAIYGELVENPSFERILLSDNVPLPFLDDSEKSKKVQQLSLTFDGYFEYNYRTLI